MMENGDEMLNGKQHRSNTDRHILIICIGDKQLNTDNHRAATQDSTNPTLNSNQKRYNMTQKTPRYQSSKFV